MSRRAHFNFACHDRSERVQTAAVPAAPDLFAPLDQPTPAPAYARASAAVSELEKQRRRKKLGSEHWAEIQRLKPHVLELALRAGKDGLVIGDVRLMAERKGLLPPGGRGAGRELSWLASLLPACGLISTGRRRLSPQPKARNDQVIFVHEAFAA